MEIKNELVEKTFKAGSIMMEKRHNWFKRLWYKIRGKDLPYNKFEIFTENCVIITADGDADSLPFVIASPKKNYTAKEIKTLQSMIPHDMEWLLLGNAARPSEADIITAINKIRPNTIASDTLNELFENKYYTIEKW